MSFVIGTSGEIDTKYLALAPRRRKTRSERIPRHTPLKQDSARAGQLHIGGHFDFRTRHSGIARSLDYIARHWRKPIKVTDLARAARMSRRGYLKAFQRHTGGTPARRVRAVRLENARRMLLGGDERLRTVARDSGFRSVNSFIVAFKREVGIAPIQFRDSNRALKKNKIESMTFRTRRISNLLCRNLNGNL